MTVKSEDCTPKRLGEIELSISGPSTLVDRFERFCDVIAAPSRWEALETLLDAVDEQYQEVLTAVTAEAGSC